MIWKQYPTQQTRRRSEAPRVKSTLKTTVRVPQGQSHTRYKSRQNFQNFLNFLCRKGLLFLPLKSIINQKRSRCIMSAFYAQVRDRMASHLASTCCSQVRSRNSFGQVLWTHIYKSQSGGILLLQVKKNGRYSHLREENADNAYGTKFASIPQLHEEFVCHAHLSKTIQTIHSLE